MLWHKFWLWAEFIVLFIFLPFLFLGRPLNIPPFAVLFVVTAICFLIQYVSGGEINLKFKPIPDDLRIIIAIFVIIAFLLGLLVYIFIPERLFFFPKNKPLIWLLVMIFYPVLSVLPQEFIYRVFFFHRYSSIFNNIHFLIFINSVSFAILHIIFRNWQSVVLTFLGSFLFARNYKKNRSLFWVSFEHYLYGGLVFTLGLGNYFYGATFS